MAYETLSLYGREDTQDKTVPVADAVAAGLVSAPVTAGGVTQTVAQHLAGKAPANVVAQTQVAVSGTAAPRGLLDVIPEIVGRSDILARTYFGMVDDGVLASNGTATGTDNTAALNAYALWCRDNDRTLFLPPGDYVVKGQITLWTNVVATGARLLIPNNGAPDIKIVVNPLPGDITPIPVSAVRTWTGCFRGSRKIGGLTGRRGQIISVNSPNQFMIRRAPDAQQRYVQMGQTFVMATNDGDIATSLTGNWNNSTWTNENGVGPGEDKVWYRAETPRDRLVLKDLTVVLYDDGATTPTGYVLRVNRSNVTTEGLRIVNRANRSIAQAVSTNRVSAYRDIGGIVEGTLVEDTNYGWNHGLGVGHYHECSQALNCRRGVDNHMSTDILLLNCILPTGWGAHFGFRMGSIGGVLGCKGQDNTVLNIAGSDFYCHDADVQIEDTVVGTGSTAVYPTFIKGRGDYLEYAGKIESRGCRITVLPGTSQALLTDFRGPAGGTNPTRAVEMPRQLKISAQVDMLGDANQRLNLLVWLQNWKPVGDDPANPAAGSVPQPLLVESVHDFDVAVRFANGGALTTSGAPRVLAEYWSPPCANAGQPYDGYVRATFRGLPSFDLYTQTGYLEAVNTKARLDADIRATGPVRVMRSVGAYRQITVDAPSLEQVLKPETATYPAIGDESVRDLNAPLDPLDNTPVRPAISIRFLAGFVPEANVFSRASAATYLDARGVLLTAASGVPRFTCDPLTGESRGLLIEGGATNFLVNSTAPATQTVSLAAGTYTLWVVGTGSATLSGGPAGSATQGSPVTFTLGATTSVTVTCSGTLSRFQLENGSFPTSFVSTAASSATRAPDAYSYTLPANTWNTAEGTFVFDGYAPAGAANGLQQAIEWGDGSGGNRLLVVRSPTKVVGISLIIAGTGYPITLNTPWPDNTRLRIAIAVGGGTMAASVNGNPVVTVPAPSLPPATRMRVGDGANGNSAFYGSVLSADYIQRRVANRVLPAMSVRNYPR